MSNNSGSKSEGNKRVLHIPQSSSNAGASQLDCLVSYPGYSLGGLTILQRCGRCIPLAQGSGLTVKSFQTLLSDTNNST